MLFFFEVNWTLMINKMRRTCFNCLTSEKDPMFVDTKYRQIVDVTAIITHCKYIQQQGKHPYTSRRIPTVNNSNDLTENTTIHDKYHLIYYIDRRTTKYAYSFWQLNERGSCKQWCFKFALSERKQFNWVPV